MEQRMEQMQICPICTKEDPCLALSRHDDETEICSDCGTLEGLIVAGLVMSEETKEFVNNVSLILGSSLERTILWGEQSSGWEIHRVKMLIAKGCYTDFVYPKPSN